MRIEKKRTITAHKYLCGSAICLNSRSCCDFHYVKVKNTKVLQYNNLGTHMVTKKLKNSWRGQNRGNHSEEIGKGCQVKNDIQRKSIITGV